MTGIIVAGVDGDIGHHRREGEMLEGGSEKGKEGLWSITRRG